MYIEIICVFVKISPSYLILLCQTIFRISGESIGNKEASSRHVHKENVGELSTQV